MPQEDRYHELVRRALAKQGWVTIAEQKRIDAEGFYFFVDLVVRNDETIAVEVKSFISGSNINDFKEALGQYLLYRAAFEDLAIRQQLFLAIPHAIYVSFFQIPVIRRLVVENRVHCITFDVMQEELVEWNIH
jgi:hypothetical protein